VLPIFSLLRMLVNAMPALRSTMLLPSVRVSARLVRTPGLDTTDWVRSSQKAGLLPLANAPPGGEIPLKNHGGMIAVLSSQLRPAWLGSKRVVFAKA
jgi:hypothetical protein